MIQSNLSSKQWATSVMKEVTNYNGASPFYFDIWADFKKEFLKQFGIYDEAGHYQRVLFNIKQGTTNWEAFYIEFERAREEAGYTKDNAFHLLKMATNRALYNKVMDTYPSPKTYDDFCRVAADKTQDARDAYRIYQPVQRMPHAGHHKVPDHLPVSQGGSMMDIDRLHHGNKNKKKDAKGKGKPQPKATSSARNPTPQPFMGRINVPIGGGLTDRRTVPRGVCFRCLKPGHFAAKCSESISNIAPEHINNLLSLAIESYEVPIGLAEEDTPQEDYNETEEEDEEEDPPHQINQVSDNLIDFDTVDNVEVPTSSDSRF
jgi:hypothetical protein